MVHMKIPIINKYFCVNILLYIFIATNLSYIISLNSFIGSNFGYIWVIFVVFAILTDYIVIPVISVLSLLEFFLFKLKVLKYKTLKVNASPRVQKIVYTLAAMSFAYYLWFKLYYEPILDKMLELD